MEDYQALFEIVKETNGTLLRHVGNLEAWSRLWKQTAKENRGFYQITYGVAKSNQLKWHKAQADADRRLELLRNIDKVLIDDSQGYVHQLNVIAAIVGEELADDRN